MCVFKGIKYFDPGVKPDAWAKDTLTPCVSVNGSSVAIVSAGEKGSVLSLHFACVPDVNSTVITASFAGTFPSSLYVLRRSIAEKLGSGSPGVAGKTEVAIGLR